MANHISHAALPYPVKGCRYTIPVPHFDADGDPTDPTTPDTERSIDATPFADCAEEVSSISGGAGTGYITLTGDETNCSLLEVQAKAASGPKTSLAMLFPRVLPVLRSGTAQAGAAGTITLDASASAIDDYYNGCIVRTTGGTGGGGGSGSQGNQARIITDYNGSTKVATVVPNWETNPSNDTTFEVLQTPEWAARLADLRLWNGTAPSNLQSGRVDGYLGAGAADVITASLIADGAIDAGAFAQGAADKVWSSATRTLSSFGTLVSDIWSAGTRTLTGFGTLVSDIWAAVVDSSGVTTLLSRLTGSRAGYLDNLSAGAVAQQSLLTTVAGYLDTEIAAIKAKTDNLPASPAAVGSAMTLTSGERDSIAAALLDLSNGVETSLTLRGAIRLMTAALAGKLSGAATTTITIRNVGDTKARITATVDADGNRSAVTTDAT